MRSKTLALTAVLLAAVLLLVTPLGAQAAKLITGKRVKDSSLTGKDVKDDSLTGKDVAEKSLGVVPKAKSAATADTATTAGTAGHADTADTADVAESLAVLGAGETQSGTFSMGGGVGVASGEGYLGFGITYPRPLAEPIAYDNVIDTEMSPDPALCPGPGQAAPGYLCLYSNERNSVGEIYGYTDSGPYDDLPVSVGIGMYVPVAGEVPFVDGIWTVTAPVAD